MDRTRTGPVAAPTNRELTVGLVGAVISLAITMLHNMTDDMNEGALLQAMVPIQQMLVRLVRRIQMLSTPGLANKTRPARHLTPSSTPRRSGPVARPRKLPNVTQTRTSGPGTPSFVIPPGWREISNLDSYLDESSELELGMGSEGTFDQTPMMSDFEYSHDQDYHPSFNREVAALEDSDRFLPVHQSTPRNMDQTYNRTARSSAQPIPRRVEQLRKPNRNTFRKGDGTYAVRETINTTNPDGSFQRITKTVSGPDVSIIQNLSENAAELPTLNRTRTEPSSDVDGPNRTYGVNLTS